MEHTVKRTLTEGEYLAIYNLGANFKGSAAARFAATVINEKITTAVRAGVTKINEVVDGVETSKDVNPSSIEINFTLSELTSFFIGVKEILQSEESNVEVITILGAICKALKMFGMFSSHLESIISNTGDAIALDEE